MYALAVKAVCRLYGESSNTEMCGRRNLGSRRGLDPSGSRDDGPARPELSRRCLAPRLDAAASGASELGVEPTTRLGYSWLTLAFLDR
jgi:hypothetical protein